MKHIDANRVPDKAQILAITMQAKGLELDATRVEEESGSNELSDEAIETMVEQSVISQVEPNLYLSGYDALEEEATLDDLGITHILSVCRYSVPVCSAFAALTCASQLTLG